MTSSVENLARRAFDTVAALQEAKDLVQLDRAAGPTFQHLGFPYYAAARFFHSDGAPATSVLFGSFHRGWASRYATRNYAGSSQIAKRMLQTTRSYSWSDVLSGGDPDPAQLRIWNEARDFGLNDGLFTPLRGPDGSYIAVALSGEATDLEDPAVRVAGQIVSTFYAAAGLQLSAVAPRRRVILTPRQRECLTWVRQGKSSPDIADILGLSAHTVEEHIADACRRLGVGTRTQAVVEASLAGLIEL